MRALVFGETGQVARELARVAAARGIEATFLGRAAADLADPEACARAVRAADVDIVVNAAAHTQVDRAEDEPALAETVNAAAPGAMAAAAAARGLPLLHVSTDYVFDGAPGRPWREDDHTAPAQRLRREQARAASGWWRRPTPTTPSCAPPGSSPRTGGTSCAPCSRSAAAATRCAWSATSAAARPGPATSPRRSGPSPPPGPPARAGQGSSTTPAPPRSAGPSSPRRSSPAAAGARRPKVVADRHRANGRPAPRGRRTRSSTAPPSPRAYGIAQPDWRPALDARHRRARGGGGMSGRKGIVLAGGSGTRLYPITHSLSKQLLPLYDKPMIYYPLSVLMLAGLREIAIITTPEDQEQFRRLLKDGAQWGMRFEYVAQPRPEGLAQAYVLAEDFLAGSPSTMVLGDNIFFGHDLPLLLKRAGARAEGGTVFGYHVADPERYGVVEFDRDGRVLSLEEKPARPKSSFAVTGIYVLDGTAPARARALTPSARGELEIVDVLNGYLADGLLERRADGPRLRLARHRHPRQPARRRQLRAHHRGAAELQDRLPRGDRLRRGLDRRRRPARPGRSPTSRPNTAATSCASPTGGSLEACLARLAVVASRPARAVTSTVRMSSADSSRRLRSRCASAVSG